MSDDRWRRIEELFHEAASLAPIQRAEFLSRVCAGDDELRWEIASLLANDKSKDDVLQAAVRNAAEQLPAESSDGRDDLLGKHIGPYLVIELAGKGGMGLVYTAHDSRLGRSVALKFLRAESTGDLAALDRFRREARTLSALNHPNICTIYEIGGEDSQPFIAMELMDGKTLKDTLEGHSIPLDQLLYLGVEITDALDAAHAAGIVHRDIKPANIFVTKRGHAKILDFGLAKLSPEKTKTASPTQAATEAMLTTPGQAMGTIAYMSPEQARGEELDARTDLWSFGAVLYEMATGRVAFPGSSAAMIHDAILNRAPAAVSHIKPELPLDLERVINKGLEKDRKLRYQSAAEMRTDLQRLKRDSESGRTMPAPSASRSPRLVLLAIILVAAAAGLYFFLHKPTSKLTDKDTIVLTEFSNTTGDSVFDGTLRQGLSAQLEQSPFLYLLSDQRIAETLALMAQPKGVRLTQELGREVCQRTASAATIEGSIGALGSQYVLGLKAVNCRSGDLLAEEQVTANGKERVLTALGHSATKLREKLGESLASVQKYDVPLQNVTTSSLEALQAYSLGYQEAEKFDFHAAIPFYQRAVALDPNFAMAYAKMGVSYAHLGEESRGTENLRQAYGLRGPTSEQEKLYISAHYDGNLTGNLEAARTDYELWAKTYPRDSLPQNNLASIYLSLGQDEKALTAALAALKLDPEGGYDAGPIMAYLSLDRLDEAQATAREAMAHHHDTPLLQQILYQVDFVQHNTAGMERLAAELMGKPGYDARILSCESHQAAYTGEFAKARELTRRAVESAQRIHDTETAGAYQAFLALDEAWAGNTSLANKEALAALDLAKGQDVEISSALALSLAGDSAQAERLAGDLGKRFPEDTIIRFECLPEIDAAVHLRSGDPGKAVQSLAAAAPYERGAGGIGFYGVYLRGEAYLAASQGAAARGEFQRILDHPGLVAFFPIGALAHLGLGRANALAGDTAKAKTAYQDFFALWKNADPDIPILKQAKDECAKLQ